MLDKSARSVSRELCLEKRACTGLSLLHIVSWECCDNALLLWKTCFHAVYHRPMASDV